VTGVPDLVDVLVLMLLLACAGTFLTALARKLVSGAPRLALAKPFACDLCMSFWTPLLAADLAQYVVAPGLAPTDVLRLACALLPAWGACLVLVKTCGGSPGGPKSASTVAFYTGDAAE